MNYYDGKKGWVECICGPMFSGKTEELIKIIDRMEIAKKKYQVFKPAIDKRYEENYIVSHNGQKVKATNISHGSDLIRFIKPDTQAIIIDEVQFLDKSLLQYIYKLTAQGIRVICGGLDRDFRGEPFGCIGDILAISDKVTKLTAVCAVTGEEATMTQRIIDGEPARYDDPQVLVGAGDKYEPRCRDSHVVIYDK